MTIETYHEKVRKMKIRFFVWIGAILGVTWIGMAFIIHDVQQTHVSRDAARAAINQVCNRQNQIISILQDTADSERDKRLALLVLQEPCLR